MPEGATLSTRNAGSGDPQMEIIGQREGASLAPTLLSLRSSRETSPIAGCPPTALHSSLSPTREEENVFVVIGKFVGGLLGHWGIFDPKMNRIEAKARKRC